MNRVEEILQVWAQAKRQGAIAQINEKIEPKACIICARPISWGKICTSCRIWVRTNDNEL